MKTSLDSLVNKFIIGGICCLLLFACDDNLPNDVALTGEGKLKRVLLFANIEAQEPISIVEEYEYDGECRICRISSPMYEEGEGKIKYDDRWSVSALYNNNQFDGTWIEYGKDSKSEANWGDSRIPDSGDLDVGTSEFGVNRKYQANGWDSFIKATSGGYSDEETKQAREKEMEQWWKE